MWSTSSRMRRARAGPTRSTFCRNKPIDSAFIASPTLTARGVPSCRCKCRRAAARLAAVLDVVVHQECVVQHLEARGGGDGLARPAAERPADGQAERGTKALARLRHERAQGGVEVLAGFGRRDRVVHGRERQTAVPGEALGEPGRAVRDIGLRRAGVARFRPSRVAWASRSSTGTLPRARRGAPPAPAQRVRPRRRPPRGAAWRDPAGRGCPAAAACRAPCRRALRRRDRAPGRPLRRRRPPPSPSRRPRAARGRSGPRRTRAAERARAARAAARSGSAVRRGRRGRGAR